MASQIKVDTVTNAAGTGAPASTFGVVYGSGGTANTTSDANLGTISSVTQTSFYTGTFSTTWTFGAGGATFSTTNSYVKIGNLVILRLVAGSANVGSNISTFTSGAIPSALRPTGNTVYAAALIQSANTTTNGSVTIASSGVMTIAGANLSNIGTAGGGVSGFASDDNILMYVI